VAIRAFIAGWFGLWNALLEMEVLDLVNAKLPPEKQYPLLWGNYRYFELRSEYKKIFPSGTLLRKTDRVKLIAVSIMLGGIVLQLLPLPTITWGLSWQKINGVEAPSKCAPPIV
jgi:hypothetical protein